MTDQQSMAALGANGNPYLKTPAMDSLAAGGVSFTESYCTYPVCSPARSSIMTGLMPHQTGVEKNGQAIAEGIPNLGRHFRKHGYRTYYAGKWHLPKGFGEPEGFETLVGGHTLGAHMDEPLATKCVEFLHQGTQEPFLLVASFMNPHDICHWIRGHEGSRDYETTARYPPAPGNFWRDPQEPEYVIYHREANYNRMSNSLHISKEWKVDDFRHYLHDYYRMVEDVDRQIGRVLSALRFRGLMENTVAVLTSDHGEGMGAHRWTQKAAFWEETAKVPLIVAGKGIERRGAVDSRTLASGADIVPTLCDYAGAAAGPRCGRKPAAGDPGQAARPRIRRLRARRPRFSRPRRAHAAHRPLQVRSVQRRSPPGTVFRSCARPRRSAQPGPLGRGERGVETPPRSLEAMAQGYARRLSNAAPSRLKTNT